jgi:tetratricopeptide (TPR) repeat protein
MAIWSHNVGCLLLNDFTIQEALPYLERALALDESIGGTGGAVLVPLGVANLQLGRYYEAFGFWRRFVEENLARGSLGLVAKSLANMVMELQERGHFRLAAMLLGSIDAVPADSNACGLGHPRFLDTCSAVAEALGAEELGALKRVGASQGPLETLSKGPSFVEDVSPETY